MESDTLLELKFKKDEEFHLKQANHNYLFCYNTLEISKAATNEGGIFFDWVITSSFYSSLHYVRCALSKDKEFSFYGKYFEKKTFDDARKDRRRNEAEYPKDAVVSRHEIVKRITQETYPVISCEYNMLLDKSMTSRYYQFNNATIDECEDTLALFSTIRDWFSTKFSILLPIYTVPTSVKLI